MLHNSILVSSSLFRNVKDGPTASTLPLYTDARSGCLPGQFFSGSDSWTRANIISLKGLLYHAANSDFGLEYITTTSPPTNSVATSNVSYRELLQNAEVNAPIIRRAADAMATQTVLVHCDTIKENIELFWIIVFAGLVPVMSTPLPVDSQSCTAHLRHLKFLLDNPLCITSPTFKDRISTTSSLRVRTLQDLKTEHANSVIHTSPIPFRNSRNMPAVMMLTSGSTGNAKAVSLTTQQIIASISSKSKSLGSDRNSIFLNWIGLDHVANLLEIHMHAMVSGAKQVHVQASDVLREPLLFLRIINEHRVSHTFAPNFFLALLEKELRLMEQSEPLHSVNLSCLRTIVSGGEANPVETANDLTQRLNKLGARGQIIHLGFGMTETCAACMYGILDSAYESSEKHQFASVGKCIGAVQARIMADGSKIARPYEHGHLELSGPAIFKEYFNNPTATQEAFTQDGWFRTGDRAFLDKYGKLNLVGRAKEVLNINGVKFAPADIESLLEKANLPNVLPSYYAVFPDRRRGQQTEGYCVVYGAEDVSGESTFATAEEVARIASSVVAIRPNWIIPLSKSRLEKSSLGKLARTKIQKLFVGGSYDDVKIESFRPLSLSNEASIQSPKTQSEQSVVEVLSEMLDIPTDLISTDATIFELGVTSVTLFHFERLLRRKLGLGNSISIITFLSNPTIVAIADAINNAESKIYNPVAQIQNKGSKTPLWLCHPASGNVLAFLPLSRTITDRPLYALTARGLRHNESLFSSIPEMCDTYYQHVKRVQPQGPYALTGYSLGTTVAFELAKRLEANGDEVAFCAALDSPPHVIPLVGHLDWTAAAVLVSYFLELIAQDEVPGLIVKLRGLPHTEIVQRLLDVARPMQRQVLNLDPEQLLAIVNVTDNFGNMAKSYHPQGDVKKVDVFYCTPLHSVEENREKWIDGHLSKWQDFSRDGIEYHECEGDHADMLNPTYVRGFERILSRVLAARGI